jgi:hypothetical protein
MGMFKRWFGGKKAAAERSGPLVRCPHCGKAFENRNADNPLDALVHGMLSTSGRADTSAVSDFLGLAPADFTCPHCKKQFRL